MNTSQLIQLSLLSLIGLFTIFIFPLNILYVYVVTRAYSINNEAIIENIPVVINDIYKGSKDIYNKINIYLKTNSKNDGSGYEADSEVNECVTDNDRNNEQVNADKAAILESETTIENNGDDQVKDDTNTETTIQNIVEINNNLDDNKVYNLRKRPDMSDSEIELSELRVSTSI